MQEATYNSHAPTHLPQQVENHGPLIQHSAFMFESMLAHLKWLFHGTRGIPDQIVGKLAVAQHSTRYIFKETCNNPPLSELAEKILKPDSKAKVDLNCGIKFFMPLQQGLPTSLHHIQNFPEETEGLAVAQQMVKDGQIYHSCSYVRKKKFVSFNMLWKNRIFCQIRS